MTRFSLVLLLIAVLADGAYARDEPTVSPHSPQTMFGDLFDAVQEAHVFPDGKEFADAVPNSAPQRILHDYRTENPRTTPELRKFVEGHFTLPGPSGEDTDSTERIALVAHIDALWGALTRSTPAVPAHGSLIALPHPYVVPGGRFRELYYWDSYFTMLGLKQSGRGDLVRNMVDDFAVLIDTFGHVPNGTRTYYLSRSQPPFFFEMVGLLNLADPPAAYARYLPQLIREHAYWMRGAQGLVAGGARRRVVAMDDGSVLNRFWDDLDTPRDESYAEDTALARASGREPHQLYRDIRAAAESGWDFGSRWFSDGRTRATLATTDIVPVDLNSLLYGLEKAIAAGCARGGDDGCGRRFKRAAARRRTAIDHYLWDDKVGAYFDYRRTGRARIPRLSAATLYPLFVGAASAEQATATAAAARRDLLRAGGIVTSPVVTGQQWDAPNGWAPLQWIAVDGLRRYGQELLAAQIACRWMSGVAQVYRASGKLVEKYDVVDVGRRGGGGEYPTQDGFGWTNGVMRRLVDLYPKEWAQATAEECPGDATHPAAPSVK